jgi:sigma-B regulation protein RsbU (phosphoserine phosphatase)
MTSGHMPRNLTARLIVWGLALTGAIFIVTIGFSNLVGRRAAIAGAQREAFAATDAAAQEIEGVLSRVEESVASLARAVSETEPSPAALDRLVARFNADNRAVVARYDVRVAGPGDDAAAPDWYRETLDRRTPGWSEPYRNPDLPDAVVITCGVPVGRADGTVIGAAAASVRLDFLSAVLRKVRLGDSGIALAVSRHRLLVAHSRLAIDTPFDPVANLSPELRAQVEPIVRHAEAGEAGFTAIPVDGRMYRLTVRQIGQTGGLLATGYAEDELLANVTSMRLTQVLLALAGLAVLAGAIVILSRRITRPIVALAASADRLATGDLDTVLPTATSQDEVGALTGAFHHMRDSLKVHIRHLQETTAAKERLESEMRAAHRIQSDMLPPPAAGGASEGYELAAVLVPARAVGGDLFAHFQHGRRVFFLVGDVSGKGVAAALFMARAKTLFDTVAATEHDPGAVFATLNRGLCRQNDAGMYVTAVCGVLDLDTRTLSFSAAGHEPPVLVRRAEDARSARMRAGASWVMEGGDTRLDHPRLAMPWCHRRRLEAQDPTGSFAPSG